MAIISAARRLIKQLDEGAIKKVEGYMGAGYPRTVETLKAALWMSAVVWKELSITGMNIKPDWTRNLKSNCPLCAYIKSFLKENCSSFSCPLTSWDADSLFGRWFNSHSETDRIKHAEAIYREIMDAIKKIRRGNKKL